MHENWEEDEKRVCCKLQWCGTLSGKRGTKERSLMVYDEPMLCKCTQNIPYFVLTMQTSRLIISFFFLSLCLVRTLKLSHQAFHFTINITYNVMWILLQCQTTKFLYFTNSFSILEYIKKSFLVIKLKYNILDIIRVVVKWIWSFIFIIYIMLHIFKTKL